jgi:hypothetical protein|tara:strand:+ start:85 stop:513 length:429 start_codon:yes stop_codon:yes gene_type:complete
MPINSNNNAVFVADTTTLGEVAQEYFTVVVKDSSANALDIDGNTHKDGIVDRVLQGIQTRGTLRYYNITTTNGTLTVAVERADSWADTGTGTPASPQTAAAANLQVFLRAMGTVKCRASSSSTSDDASIDIGGTTVAVVSNV